MHWVQVWEWFPKKPSVHLGKSWKLNPTVSLFRFDTTLFFVSTLHSLEVGARCFLPNGPPIYPFFKTVVTCDVFFSKNLWQAAGLGSASDPWPLTLPPHNLDDVLLGEGEKNLTPQEMEGLGSWSFFCPLEHRFPKLPTIGWSWPSIVGRSSYQNSRWQWLQLAILFFPFEDWNCRNLKVSWWWGGIWWSWQDTGTAAPYE